MLPLVPLELISNYKNSTILTTFKGNFIYRKIRHFAEKISLVLNERSR